MLGSAGEFPPLLCEKRLSSDISGEVSESWDFLHLNTVSVNINPILGSLRAEVWA